MQCSNLCAFTYCRAKLRAVRHCLSEEEIDALAAAAHGFVGADLSAICDEAAMAALRRVIASKQHKPSTSHLTHLQPQDLEQVPLTQQHEPESQLQAAAGDQQVNKAQPVEQQEQQAITQQPSASLIAESEEAQLQCQPEHDSNATSFRQASHGSSIAVVPTVGSLPADSLKKLQPRQDNTDAQPCIGQQNATTSQQGEALYTKSVSRESGQGKLQITLADFKVAETRVRPSAMREVALEVSTLLCCLYCLFHAAGSLQHTSMITLCKINIANSPRVNKQPAVLELSAY